MVSTVVVKGLNFGSGEPVGRFGGPFGFPICYIISFGYVQQVLLVCPAVDDS